MNIIKNGFVPGTFSALIGFTFPCLIPFCLSGQLFFSVSLSEKAAKEGPLFIASSANGWNPADPAWQLQKRADGTFSLRITPDTGLIEFKVTAGSWSECEGSADGGAIANRFVLYNKKSEQVHIHVAGWERKKAQKRNTRSPQVIILSDSFFISSLNRYRRVWAYLPSSYHKNQKRYPVVYMLDGQNVFDAATAYAGEWRVDETLDSLHAVGAQEGIVIAIDNGGGNRIEEYAPWVHPRYGGGKADLFLQWVVSSLKPHIDSALRTRPEKGYTAIAGSSMGGLAACYAWMKYPDVFGSAGVFSPSFWFSSDIFTLAESRQISPSDRVYLMAGKGEGEEMCAGVMTIDSLLTKKGFSGHQLYMHIDPTGTHSESFWAVNFAHFWQWLAKTW